jgi:hypothetical protein
LTLEPLGGPSPPSPLTRVCVETGEPVNRRDAERTSAEAWLSLLLLAQCDNELTAGEHARTSSLGGARNASAEKRAHNLATWSATFAAVAAIVVVIEFFFR